MANDVAAKELRADLLEECIVHLDTLYDRGDDCILTKLLGEQLKTVDQTHWKFKESEVVPDPVYDAMRKELEQLRPDSDVFAETTASKYESSAKKITHDPPMVSISKACHEDRSLQEIELFKWMAECVNAAPDSVKNGPVYDLDAKTFKGKDGVVYQYTKREYKGSVVTYPRDYFYQSWKLDGVALALYYKNGKLVGAGLRPRNGIDGEDVTEQVQYVDGVLPQLKKPVTCSIRGEIVCLKSDFEQVQKELKAAGEKLRKNPRNHAAGGIRQFKDPKKVKQMRLSFISYSVERMDNPPYKTEMERADFVRSLGIPHVRIQPFNFYDLEKMEKIVNELDYEVDGVVIGVNSLDVRKQMGRIGDPIIGNPRALKAWKFAEEKATPKIKSIDWQTGRTGKICPVANFDPVSLAGTDVRRVTLHNIGFMTRNKIDVGTDVIVIKSGKIIPKIIGVLGNQCKGKPDYPKTCPSCGKPTKLEHTPAIGSGEDMYEVICENINCPAQRAGGLEHYLKTFGVLGLGSSKIASLVDGGKVNEPADFYKLDVSDIVSCGLSERQALLIIAGIHMINHPEQIEDGKLTSIIKRAKSEKKTIPLWKLFASFGIESAGKSAGKALVDHFGDFNAIRNASVAELESVQDVGAKTAGIIYEYMKENKKSIDNLLQYVEPELPKQGKLSGKIFCLSGGFTGGKKEIEAKIEAQGGKIAGVSKTCNYLVQGTDPGLDKEAKANKLKVPIITAADLEKML